MSYTYLEQNFKLVKEKIQNAARASGRNDEDILLMPAVKYASADEINYLHNNLGVNHIGENRVQQLLEHWEKIDRDGLNVHFIGSLQTNKVKYIIDKVCLIHSLDSEHLAKEIDKQAKKRGIVMNVLLEINSGGEESKGGVLFEQAEQMCVELSRYENIKLCGFMTMAPKCENKNQYHEYFSKTREVCEHIWYEKLKRQEKPVLSMGMSDSYEIAIEEGSTLVRVGGALFRK